MKLLRPAVLSLVGLIGVCPHAHAAPRRPQKSILLTNGPATGSGSTGDYRGVTPGLPRMPRIHLPKNANKRCYLTWTGFQLLPTGSRLFLQFNKKPTVIKTVKGAALTIKLPGCGVANANNTRPLYTRYFPTPVRYARVRRHHKATWMTVLLKKPVAARSRVVRLQGWYYLFVTFQHTGSGWAPRIRRPRPRTRRPKRKRRGRRGPTP